MCPAKGRKHFVLADSEDKDNGNLQLSTIDDYGGYHQSEIILKR
jgi:P pilus assembly chaperone PapD